MLTINIHNYPGDLARKLEDRATNGVVRLDNMSNFDLLDCIRELVEIIGGSVVYGLETSEAEPGNALETEVLDLINEYNQRVYGAKKD